MKKNNGTRIEIFFKGGGYSAEENLKKKISSRYLENLNDSMFILLSPANYICNE